MKIAEVLFILSSLISSIKSKSYGIPYYKNPPLAPYTPSLRTDMKIHFLKIHPKYFNQVVEGNKKFELRKDDRDFKVGDEILLLEYNNGKYTRKKVYASITYILRDCPEYGLKKGYVILGIQKIKI